LACANVNANQRRYTPPVCRTRHGVLPIQAAVRSNDVATIAAMTRKIGPSIATRTGEGAMSATVSAPSTMRAPCVRCEMPNETPSCRRLRSSHLLADDGRSLFHGDAAKMQRKIAREVRAVVRRPMCTAAS
jgi:hypothetical protein